VDKGCGLFAKVDKGQGLWVVCQGRQWTRAVGCLPRSTTEKGCGLFAKVDSGQGLWVFCQGPQRKRVVGCLPRSTVDKGSGLFACDDVSISDYTASNCRMIGH
jgi:hypothetical protein